MALNVAGKFRGGLLFWRGRWGFGVNQQSGAGVDAQKVSGFERGGFGQAAAPAGLAESLPGNAERGSAAGGLADSAGQLVKKAFHPVISINRARARLVVTRRGMWAQFQLPLCQCVVDKSPGGESKLFMTLA